MKRVSFLFLTFLLTLTLQAARYRVNNATAQIWDADNPGVELARKEPGFTFSADEVIGNNIYFNYNGKRGFIKRYLCSEIPEAPNPANTDIEAENVPAPANGSADSSNSVNSFALRPLFNGLAGIWFFGGLVMAFFLFFDRQHCTDRFNQWAGAKVAKFISWKNLRPLGFLFFFSIGNELANEAVGLAIACVYEFILLAFRASHYRSWRAAIIEALYLFLWSGGAIIIVSIAILFLLFAHQPSPSKGKRKIDECCSNCAYGSRNNDSTCECRYHGITVNMNSRCNRFTT